MTRQALARIERFVAAPKTTTNADVTDISRATALDSALDICKEAANDCNTTTEQYRRLFTTTRLRPATIQLVKTKIIDNLLFQVEIKLKQVAASSKFVSVREAAKLSNMEQPVVADVLQSAQEHLDELERSGSKQRTAELKLRMLRLTMDAHIAGLLKISYIAGHKTNLIEAAKECVPRQTKQIVAYLKKIEAKQSKQSTDPSLTPRRKTVALTQIRAAFFSVTGEDDASIELSNETLRKLARALGSYGEVLDNEVQEFGRQLCEIDPKSGLSPRKVTLEGLTTWWLSTCM